MKHRKLATLVLGTMGLLAVLSACGKEETVVGRWEIRDITVLGMDEEESADPRVVFDFQEDNTGTNEIYVGERHDVLNFTYTVEENVIHVEYEDGDQQEWPFALDGDTLTLTQNHTDISYTRTEK